MNKIIQIYPKIYMYINTLVYALITNQEQITNPRV